MATIYLDTEFLIDHVDGPVTFPAGTRVSLPQDYARGLARSEAKIWGPGDIANAPKLVDNGSVAGVQTQLDALNALLQATNADVANTNTALGLVTYNQPFVSITGLPTSGATTDAAPAINAVTQQTGTTVGLNKSLAVVPVNTNLQVSRIDLGGQVSFAQKNRGGLLLQARTDMAATTDGITGQGGGAPNSVIRAQRNSPVSTLSLSTVTEISGFTVDGTAQRAAFLAGTAPAIIGLRVPNPNKSKNAFDPDPNFVSNKDNKAPRMSGFDILNMSGDGISIESGNGTAYVQDVHSIGHLGRGIVFAGNDNVLGPRNGFGNCGGHAVQFGSGSGGLMTPGNNVWGGGPSKRRGTAVAMFYNDTSGGYFGGSVIQDTVILKPEDNRGVIFSDIIFAPLESVFSADGIATNLDEPVPSAPTDMTLQAWVWVKGGYNSYAGPNLYSRTNKVGFSTAVSPTGDYGTGFQYLWAVTGGAEFGGFLNYSTFAPVKPWTNPALLPIYVNGGWASGVAHDQHTGVVRNFALGANTTAIGDTFGPKTMWGCDPTIAPDWNYLNETGTVGVPNIHHGRDVFSSAIAYADGSWDRRVLINNQNRQIALGSPIQEISVAGAGVAGISVALRQAVDGQKASYYCDIVFKGGPIGLITWAQQTAPPDNPNALLFASNSIPAPTSFLGGYMAVRALYTHDQDTWEVLGVYGQTGLQSTAVTNSANAIALTNGTPTNVISLQLPPGIWDVAGGDVLQGTTATPTLHRLALSTTSATIPTATSKGYGSRGLTGTAVSGDLDTMRLGPLRVTSSAASPTTVYLVARANFSAGTMAAFGDIAATFVSAN